MIRSYIQAARISFLAFTVAAFAMAAGATGAYASFETKAEYAVLMDGETGAILYEKKGDELMSPASMSKLMTMTMLFEALEEDRISLDDEFTISENAWRKGGAASGSRRSGKNPRTPLHIPPETD